MEQDQRWILLLVGMVIIISVLMEILTRTKLIQRVSGKQADWRVKIIVVLLLGGLSILATYMGIRLPSGAICNVRDLGPMIAGLIGGPVIGLGAGLIGGIHRYFMGGLTAVPCALATVLAGLIAGALRRLNRGKLIGFWWAILFAALMECFHMGLILLIARPFSEALEVVSKIILPMVLANSVGMAISYLIITRGHIKGQKYSMTHNP